MLISLTLRVAGAPAVSLYVRAINTHGVTAVAMLFAVIPAVAGVLSWIILGQRPDERIAVGLVLADWHAGSIRGICRNASVTMHPAKSSTEAW